MHWYEICTGLKNEIRRTHARTNWDPYNAFLWGVQRLILKLFNVNLGKVDRFFSFEKHKISPFCPTLVMKNFNMTLLRPLRNALLGANLFWHGCNESQFLGRCIYLRGRVAVYIWEETSKFDTKSNISIFMQLTLHAVPIDNRANNRADHLGWLLRSLTSVVSMQETKQEHTRMSAGDREPV